MRAPYIESKIEYTFIEKLRLRFQTVFIILCGKTRKNLSVRWSINFHIEKKTFHVSLLQFLVVFVLCILRAILTKMHHRYSMILDARKAETEIVCLRIVYADMKKALARNS